MWLKSFGESKTPLLPSRKHFLHALHFRACFLLLIEPLSHIIRDVTSRSPPGEAEQELRADEDKSRWRFGTGELFFSALAVVISGNSIDVVRSPDRQVCSPE